jgi:hypothetical protein
MTAPPLPEPGSQEYLWWSQGAADEAKARDGGLSNGILDLRRQLEALGRQTFRVDNSPAYVLKILMQINCPSMLRRRFR